MRKLDVLHNVTIELLNYCNSACVHCYLEQPSPQEIEFEDVVRVIDQAIEAGAMQITLTGGEPLLHPDIAAIIKYIKSKGLSVNLLTSLNIKKGKWLEYVLQCDKIGVSLYGASKNVHEQITRVDGSFENMQSNLKYLIDNEAFVTLNITVMNENIKDLANMIAFASQLSIQYRLNYVLHGISSQTHQIGYEHLELLKRVVGVDDTNSLVEHFKCSAGSDSLWVDVNLNVYPCIFFKKKLGNLFLQTIKNIREESEMIFLIKQTQNVNFEQCRACELKLICKPCMGENYNANGDITIPCEFSCRIGKYSKYLMDC